MKIGIDVGSTAIKIVFSADNQMIWKKAVPTRPEQPALVNELIQQGLDDCCLLKKDIKTLCTTGYGRNLINGSSRVVDEITANAAGIHQLTSGRARTLINIGGQDVKIIKLSDTGRILDFKMNDKCAAGTGRFFEIVAKILDTPLNEFSFESSDEPVNINSICAVFAESEIVSLLAQGIDKHRIIKGVNNSVARRIANLTGHADLDEDVYVDGGPALNQGLIESLENELLYDIKKVQDPQFTVAWGTLFC
ncbi:MAG: CoA activase [Desulfobacterales bacterium]|nr:CoA activase [Desulfobacterales bacterium]